jgi:hypothetical protein
MILLLSNLGLFFTFSGTNNSLFFSNNPSIQRIENMAGFSVPSPKQDAVDVISGDERPRLAIQDTSTTILNKTVDNDNESFSFIENIWDDSLSSDPEILSNSSLYQEGMIYPAENGLTSIALFTRIGNTGTNKSEANENLNAEVLGGLSSGWQLEFPINQDFELVRISFKWRFDVYDPPAFDNYTELLPGVILDGTPDFQEIRCRILPAASSSEPFWIGNPVSIRNPNGTIFYRVGPNVTQDEQWYDFSGQFYVPQNDTANYTLELGAYMNTREYWNEYFDVWFDDILIEGINDVTDTTSPEPVTSGLDRTGDVSEYTFWTNFREGLWTSAIENVTVFYNRSGSVNIQTNASLAYQPLSTNITDSGYNETRWEENILVNVSDLVEYKFLVFDNAGNEFTTDIYSHIIGDYTPPVIESPLDPTNSSFVEWYGNGTTKITVNASDWGYGVDEVILNYTVDDGPFQLLSMNDIMTIGDITTYEAKIYVGYGSSLKFTISLSDTEGNTNTYSILPIISEKDEIDPVVYIDDIIPSPTEEGHTFIYTYAEDPFGEIERVFLTVTYAENDSIVVGRNSEGTILFNYSYIQLSLNESTGLYEVRPSPSTPKGALQLPYYLGQDNSYSINVYVEDKMGNNDSSSQNVVVTDIVAPKIQILDSEDPFPGKMKIWVQATDGGSGIATVTLEKRIGTGWGNPVDLSFSTSRGQYYIELDTGYLGNERIEFRINAIDNVGNSLDPASRPSKAYFTRLFVSTTIGLFLTEALITSAIVLAFTAVKVTQRRRLMRTRRRRFDIALRGGERLAYLGEEAMFGFVAAYGQGEGISSTLLWEPLLIGHFYQYLKELVDRANNTIDFVMQTRAEDMVTYVDFTIEEISCSAITFAYPVASLPQKWVSTLSLEHTPETPKQGVLFMMLLMRDKWSEVSHTFQDEITEGMQDIKNYILAGEDKGIISQKIKEFRLFISGTVEILEEIETDMDDVTDSIMGDFESEFLDDPEKE